MSQGNAGEVHGSSWTQTRCLLTNLGPAHHFQGKAMHVRLMLLLIIVFLMNSTAAVDNGAGNQDFMEGWHSKGGYKMCWNSEL